MFWLVFKIFKDRQSESVIASYCNYPLCKANCGGLVLREMTYHDIKIYHNVVVTEQDYLSLSIFYVVRLH
jgi:hypothetical protein